MASPKLKKPGFSVNIKKILVPVDFSVQSERAIVYAGSLARMVNAKVLVLHVVEWPAYWVETSFFPPGFRSKDPFMDWNQTLRERVETEVQGLNNNGINAEGHVLTGEPFKEIVKFVQENKVDMVVMGTHGRKGFAHAFMGSTAERVIERVSCPVITVKAEKALRLAPERGKKGKA
jgi:nucleotide-binding universal stress UspA family protein